MSLAYVLAGNVLVLLDGMAVGVVLLLEAEQPRRVDENELIAYFV